MDNTTEKKPRMTPKRLREIEDAAYIEGRGDAVKELRDEYEGNKLIAAMWNFAAGVLVGWVMVAPVASWAWHAFLTFVAANAH